MIDPKVIVAAGAGIGSLLLLARAGSTRSRIVARARSVVPFPREHAVNKMVTQGRAFWKGYSGCGDLWNDVLDYVGATDEFVNHDSPRRGMKWKEAVNLSKPWGAATKRDARVKFRRGGPWPRPGDLVLVGDESRGELAHAIVLTGVIGPPPRAGWSPHYQSAEYGAASNAGVVTDRQFDETGMNVGGWKRHIVGWIDADKIPTDPKYRRGVLKSILHLEAA